MNVIFSGIILTKIAGNLSSEEYRDITDIIIEETVQKSGPGSTVARGKNFSGKRDIRPMAPVHQNVRVAISLRFNGRYNGIATANNDRM